MALELTLAIIKPHVMKAPHAVKNIKKTLLSNGFYIIKSKCATMTKEECEMFYSEHKMRFFFNRLITLMCSGPVNMYILANVGAIQKWRQIMGPTKVFQAQFTAPETIRGTYGLSDTRNACHGSDSAESVEKEINILFPSFNVKKWLLEDERHFRAKEVVFCETEFVHKIGTKNCEFRSNGGRNDGVGQ